ncbi:hypothetical protein CYQ88_06465 [Hydrogenovibrio sp. SC-1]|uniref:PP0621 family protein n=1 Tax=Hydrogenovibrio sp. SC-1 TaxID=2065820 RepID=UPI000C79E9CB|nr:PP0621 family protein [Hydrogenovibrio sp. SC-1]PLA74328.1 hypothetical protein CYQ88_06465 [Hydrogenovibrio sp. SC-1]
MRALLFFILIFIVFLLVHRLIKKKPTKPVQTASDPKPMVACHYCGVHLPEEDALKDPQVAERYYCSKSHQDLAKKPS